MLWVFYGIFHSLFRAAFAETGRIFRANAWHLSFVHAVFACLIMVPLIPLMEWPSEGRFYFAAVVVAMIMSVGMLIQLNLSAQKSGRVSSIYMPLEAIGAFLIWIAIAPSAYADHAGNMLMSTGIIVSFILGSVAIMKIRSQDISLAIFSIVAPVGITYAVAGVVTKLVMPLEAENVLPTALTYVFVNNLVIVAVVGLVLLLKKQVDKKLVEPKMLKAGAITGAFAVMGYTTFVAAVAMAPNPGYIGLMAMLLPVWMMLFHRIIKAEDKASPVAAFMIVLAVIMMVISTKLAG